MLPLLSPKTCMLLSLERSKEERKKLLTLLVFKLEQGNLQFSQVLSYNHSRDTHFKGSRALHRSVFFF